MIRLLSEDTIKKIAAGEVIERPASIVKELVENSIDAGATFITVEIKNGGKSLIRVIDNGCGISSSEIALAFTAHATSKLNEFNDLYKTYSLGFRGEALSSVIAVSKVNIKTKTEKEKTGTSVDFIDSKEVKRSSISMNRGTTISVSDIFYNTPVRKKFMKQDTTESNIITNMMYKFALGHSNIGFKYLKDERLVFETKPQNSLKDNLIVLFGKQLFEHLSFIQIKDLHFTLEGYISTQQYYRANRGLQYLYINKRYIENKPIRDAVEKQFQSIIPNGRFPAFQIFISIDPIHVDVNIHPNKQTVSIDILDSIILKLEKEIKNILSENLNPIKYIEESAPQKKLYFSDETNLNKENTSYQSPERNDSFAYESITEFDARTKIDEFQNIIPYEKLSLNNEKENTQVFVTEKLSTASQNETSLFQDETNVSFIGDIFNTYLLFQKSDVKFIILDQHAAHEKILFEKFSKDFENSTLHRQDLLISEIVELSQLEYEIFQDNQNIFSEFGFNIETIGDRQLILRTVPLIMGEIPDANIIHEMIDQIAVNNEDLYDKIRFKIIRNSCKNAIKAGQKLNALEAKELYKNLLGCESPYTCPHGRPTMIEFTKKDIEKIFLRIK